MNLPPPGLIPTMWRPWYCPTRTPITSAGPLATTSSRLSPISPTPATFRSVPNSRGDVLVYAGQLVDPTLGYANNVDADLAAEARTQMPDMLAATGVTL